MASDAALMALIHTMASDDWEEAVGLLDATPDLAATALRRGATRDNPNSFFLENIRHHIYAGDTPLHGAAAAHRPTLIDDLVKRGADVSARNRRGATPLHYAVDGSTLPDQGETVIALLRAGADPNATDKSSVAPLHRAVRNRSAAAVRSLLDGGADATLSNGSGSTPMQLAEWTTGKSGSGTADAKAKQAEIIDMLERHLASG